MKKLFSLVLAILLVLSFAGCTEEGTPEPQETETGSITVSVEFEDGTEESHVIDFEIGTEETVLEVIETELDITYSVSGSGSFITGVEGIETQYGNYIAIYHNGEMSPVGIDFIEYNDGDTLMFTLSWWDMTAKAVYDAINLFLENQASNYVSESMIDYNVISGLALLNSVDEYVTAEAVETYYADMTVDTVASYFKKIVTFNAVGLDTSVLLTELDGIYTAGSYGQTAYGVLAAHSVTDFDTTNIDALADAYFTATRPYTEGLDTGGISLVALAEIVDYDDVRITEFLGWIQADQLITGGIKTRDSVWGDTTYPGTENAASMSQVILGMIAVNENPASQTYTVDGNNLITRLLDFQTDTGSFEWQLDQGEDLMFSTPQAFLALVAFHIHINEFAAVNPYDFN